MIKSEVEESSLTPRGREMRRHLEEAEKRGESDAALGVRIGVKPGTVTWWRREIRRRSLRRRTAALEADLIPVSVRRGAPSAVTVEPAAFVVEISGARIEVPTGFSESELRRLVGVVRSC